MARGTETVDEFELGPYSRRDLVFHFTGGALISTLWVVAILWLARAVPATRGAWVWLVLAVLAALYLADLVSGLLHWAFDTWFDPSITFIRRMVIQVREHHIHPKRIFKFSFYHDAGTLSWIALFLTVPFVLWAILGSSSGSGVALFLVATAVVFTPLLVFMLEFHKCGHRRENPAFVCFFQRCGILLSLDHHMRHHSANHDVNYCLINGWADRTLGRAGLFRGLEKAIHKLIGAEPQRDDHEWFRRHGRNVAGRGRG